MPKATKLVLHHSYLSIRSREVWKNALNRFLITTCSPACICNPSTNSAPFHMLRARFINEWLLALNLESIKLTPPWSLTFHPLQCCTSSVTIYQVFTGPLYVNSCPIRTCQSSHACIPYGIHSFIRWRPCLMVHALEWPKIQAFLNSWHEWEPPGPLANTTSHLLRREENLAAGNHSACQPRAGPSFSVYNLLSESLHTRKNDES